MLAKIRKVEAYLSTLPIFLFLTWMQVTPSVKSENPSLMIIAAIAFAVWIIISGGEKLNLYTGKSNTHLAGAATLAYFGYNVVWIIILQPQSAREYLYFGGTWHGIMVYPFLIGWPVIDLSNLLIGVGQWVNNQMKGTSVQS